MRLTRLCVKNVRNLSAQPLEFSKKINWLIGANGSGKTSLLEAIALLGRGKSFRTPWIRDVISHHQKELQIFGEVVTEAGETHRLGISKNSDGTSVYRIDGQNAKALDLISFLPLQIITPKSFELINGPPKDRRNFLDTMMFHVEHSYAHWWHSYQRALKQRMAALKSKEFPGPWEQEMAHYGDLITQSRAQWAMILMDLFQAELNNYLGALPIALNFFSGWDPQLGSLISILKDNRGKDSILGFATDGPHRADFKITTQNRMVAKVLSRGQIKVCTIAFYLAQARVLREHKQIRPVWLLDDLMSEVDPSNREQILSGFSELGESLFISAVDVPRGTFP